RVARDPTELDVTSTTRPAPHHLHLRHSDRQSGGRINQKGTLMNTRRHSLFISTSAVVAGGLLLAGCASAPADPGTDVPEADSGFIPCMVSDSGGFDDKSFNQSGFEGLVEASDALGVEPVTVESASDTDFSPNIDQLISQDCSLIVSVGYLLADATKT